MGRTEFVGFAPRTAARAAPHRLARPVARALAAALAFALAAAAAAQPAPPATALSRGYRGIELGMGRDEVIAALKKDPLYAYRGPEDVTLLSSPNQSLIDVSGLSFVRRAFFQFHESRLWSMIYILDPERIDHYSIYTSLSAKYGGPGLLDPGEARWEDGMTRVSLERPLTLRYLDLATFEALGRGSSVGESVVELEREEFLGGL